jgi:two-component system, OmpR family, sensor histidine kinase BaeS
MFASLRARFIASHVLPLLIVLPIMGIALIYIVETQVLLDSAARETAAQAGLVAQMAGDRADVWRDPAQARAFVQRVGNNLDADVLLIDPRGVLLAASNPAQASLLVQAADPPGSTRDSAAQRNVQTFYSQAMGSEVVDILVPVSGPDGQVAGEVRLIQPLASLFDRFQRVRSLVAAVLLAGLLLSAALGWVLALNLQRPLVHITRAISAFADGQQPQPLPEQGPSEFGLLAHAFNQLMERLRSAEGDRRRLLANLTHELARPLGSLRSAIQALLGGAEDDVALRRDLLVGMDEETRRLQRLLDDLVRFYGQVAGHLDLQCQPLNLNEWLPLLLSTRRESAQEKGLLWQINLPEHLPAVRADPDRLAQALGNLLANAIKYTPPGGAVTVDAGADANAMWIRVSDTGPGIAPEERNRIFEPFYRGPSARRFPQGMGLGLPIARELVEAHGGRLELESAPGAGSRFVVRLPLTSTRC